jgi:hypothetical protein
MTRSVLIGCSPVGFRRRDASVRPARSASRCGRHGMIEAGPVGID